MRVLFTFIALALLTTACGPRDPFLSGKFLGREDITQGKSKTCNGGTWRDYVISDSTYLKLKKGEMSNQTYSVQASKYTCIEAGSTVNLKTDLKGQVLGKAVINRIIIDKSKNLDKEFQKLGTNWEKVKSRMSRKPRGSNPVVVITYMKVLEIYGTELKSIEELVTKDGEMFESCDQSRGGMSSLWFKKGEFVAGEHIFLPGRKCVMVGDTIKLELKTESTKLLIGSVKVLSTLLVSRDNLAKLYEISLEELEEQLIEKYGKLHDNYTIIKYTDFQAQ